MKLNEDEKRFVKCWARNFAEAIKSARAFHDRPRPEYEPSAISDYVLEMTEKANELYASYKYWYGIMFGMIQAMSLDIRISIYDACSHALNNITNAAYCLI